MLRYEVIQHRGTQTVTLHTGAQSIPTTFTCGEVRLLRRRSFKGSFFTPVVTTNCALLVFPNSCAPGGGHGTASPAPPTNEDSCSAVDPAVPTLTSEAQSCIGHFLGRLAHVPFCVSDAAACGFSGCAVVVLACPSMEDVLAVLQVCADVAEQGNDVRTSCMYVRGFSCLDGEPVTESAQLLAAYYYIPTCPMCCDRLECTVSGYGSQTPLCTCARGGTESTGQCTCFLCSSCHVCRRFADSLEHAQQLQQQQQRPPQESAAPPATVMCEACAKAGDPWICLVCGYVGCSRYQAMHARDHCVAQQHFFSMNLLTQQIWDYDGDCFVHRVLILVDSHTGSSTRMQFPGRDDPMLEDGAQGSGATGESPESWKAEKKNITAKYDKKLTSSHTQYAMVIKSELDAKRALYESQLMQEAGSSGEDIDDEDDAVEEVEGTRGGVGAALLERSEFMDLTYAFEPLESVLLDVAAKRRRTTALLYAVRNLQHELETRESETRRIEKQLEANKRALRSVIQQNVATDLRLSSSIREMQETLQDIALNAETQRRLTAQLGEQEVSRMVLIGGGGRGGSAPAPGSSGTRGGTAANASGRKRK